MQRRRWTHWPPVPRQSSQPSADGVTWATVSRCVHVSAVARTSLSVAPPPWWRRERRQGGDLEGGAVPARQLGGGLIGALQEGEERGVGVLGRAHRGVGQDELTHGVVVVSRGGLHGPVGEALGLGI